jgi:hypothetical protein
MEQYKEAGLHTLQSKFADYNLVNNMTKWFVDQAALVPNNSNGFDSEISLRAGVI